jgi:hypothetical protein
MPISKGVVNADGFNREVQLPYELRIQDFAMAMQDVYDFFFDVNTNLVARGLTRLDDMLRPALMSGVVSNMLTTSLAKHSRALTVNRYFNGHPDLVLAGAYPQDRVLAGSEGVEVKTTRKRGGAVDTHGARDQWMCVFVYEVDNITEPARDRRHLTFVEIYLGRVAREDFRRNARGELGTRTATLHRGGVERLRQSWIYMAKA